MSRGIYNFNDPYGKDIKDESPKWMDEFFNSGIKKKDPVVINDIFGNNTKKVKKCSICGNILKNNEIGKCSGCSKLSK